MTDEIRAPRRPVSPPRRMTNSLAERRWFSFIVELVLIVAGILIALYIDGWMQDRRDRTAETTYLRLLADDLSLIENEVTQYIEFENSVLATGKAFLDAISEENGPVDHRPLNGMLAEMSIRRTLSVVSAAYADLTSAGKIQLIRNPELRRQIVRYFANVKRRELIVEKNSKQYVDEIFVRFLMDAGVSLNPDQSVLLPVLGAGAVIDDVLGPDFVWPRDVILERPRGSASWDNFRRQVLYRMRIAASGRTIGERLIEMTQQLRVDIENELSRRDTN